MYPGNHAVDTPDKPAVVMAGGREVVSYRELDERSAQLARLLYDRGLREGDGLALLAENHVRYAEVLWAAMRSGLYLTAINRHATAEEAAYILRDSGAVALVATHRLAHAASSAVQGSDCRIRLMIDGTADGFESYEKAVAAYPSDPLPAQPRGEMMLYSSGTTGRPKGIRRPLLGLDVADPAGVRSAAMCRRVAGMDEYYAALASQFTFADTRPGMLGPVVVRRRPVGVVGAIVAWNVPLYLSALKLGPALLAGCTVVLKPAPDAPLSPQILAEAADEGGLPPGVLNVVPAERDASEHLVTHPGVDKISFTGSTAAGRRIAALCGERLRRVSLELGGKGAAIVLPDADLDTAVPELARYALMINGQACVAQTRILLPRDRHDEIAAKLVDHVAGLTVGDPLDPATQIGPLAAARQRERVEGYIAIGRDEGAHIALGGGRPDGKQGFFVEPTVFTGVQPGMRIAQEEIFGPVMTVIPYEDTDDAVRIADGTDYGLAGTVWTSDINAGYALADRLRVGVFGVNCFMLDTNAPFGGVKNSGIGRELGPEGLAAYLDHQTINLPPGAAAPEV